jgi:chondroitin synthase
MSLDKGIDIEPVIGLANDYTFIDYIKSKIKREYIMSQKITVVIPFYEKINELRLVVEALSYQTIPLQYIEIIICDDGSSDSTFFELISLRNKYIKTFGQFQVLTQEKRGFGLSRARNMGMIHATNPYIVIIDCDIVPLSNMLEKHIENLVVSDKVLSVGFRSDMDFSNIEPDAIHQLTATDIPKDKLDWRIKRVFSQKSTEINFRLGDTYWLLASGGNIAFHKYIINNGFLFDESFDSWGGEDTEWGYRLYKAGFYFYPALDAKAYHINGLDGFQSNRDEGRKKSIAILKDKCPKVDCSFSSNPDASIPLVSFFITCYNRALYIKEALLSLKSFYWSYEILLIDDGSTDDSIKEALSVEGVKLKVISNPHLGIAHAYSEAIKQASGEFLIQIDSDDFLLPQGFIEIKNMIALMFDKPIGLLYGSYNKYDQNGNYLDIGWRFPYSKRNMNLFGGMFVHPIRICRRRELSRMHPIDTSLKAAVDYDMYSKVLEVSYGAFMDKNFYCYRQHPGNLSKALSQEQSTNVPSIVKDRLDRMGALSYVNIDMLTKHFCLTQHKSDPSFKIPASTKHLGLTLLAKNILDENKPSIESLISPDVIYIDKHQSFVTYNHNDKNEIVDASVRQIGLFSELKEISPNIQVVSYLLLQPYNE